MGILKGKKWRLVFSFSWPCHVSSSFWSNFSKLPFESVSCQLTKETGRRLSSWDQETRGGPFVQFPNSPKFKRRGCSRIQISGPQEAAMPPNLLKCCFEPRKSFQRYLGSHPVPMHIFFTVQLQKSETIGWLAICWFGRILIKSRGNQWN